MSDSDVKLVKVDNWGIYFLQRLKHFFNRTDYCDLTLQFQDNAQLKVHRLVLSACTEYFELLERTCEMYEDCLVMPDDLQADVVVPIVNFMYTGQLEFKMDLLERLYQTSQIMNMPVLTKLLDAHRNQGVANPMKPALNYNSIKRSYSKPKEGNVKSKQTNTASSSSSKRSFSKAFGNPSMVHKENKKPIIAHKIDIASNNGVAPPYISPALSQGSPSISKKGSLGDPRPTRYELPEELDTDNIFDSSFTNISYTSQPLMTHPESTKHYSSKRSGLFGESSGSRRGTSTVDIIECKKVTNNDNIFEDDTSDVSHDIDLFQNKEPSSKISNQLFDQIIEQNEGPKVTIETKDNKQASNIDHAKIISEVLKKYPHLVKSNKNIKLKILNTPPNKPKPKKQRNSPTPYHEDNFRPKPKAETPDYTYETDVLDSKEAARLISLGAENVHGPWICLICGTPGRALHFTSYYKFRRHLVEVHNEKPVSNICEYCGLKSLKRNYLLHHMLTRHGVQPPPTHQFPKCNVCSYVALTEGFLNKHKLTHADSRTFRCNVCSATYTNSNQLLAHIQSTGHKYIADRKVNLQCIYCMKVFLREGNLYAHLKTYHKQAAKNDGIIDDSDDEQQKEDEEDQPMSVKTPIVKYEPPHFKTEFEEIETQYQIRSDGNIELVSKKPRSAVPTPTKQKILNSGFGNAEIKPIQKTKTTPSVSDAPEDFNEEIVMIDDNEYVMRDNQLIPNKKDKDQFIISDVIPSADEQTLTPSTSMDYSDIQYPVPEENLPEQKVILKKSNTNVNQSIQIVVSNEEEYKALMNSNHSIIFDDGDANKTLTVLSTPHNATLNTTALDLDNTQPNDMMIIQENYPLHVTEALPANNPNIVVVYSHSVDEPNKQFELITTQDIGAQFVQSSTVITQNFETITTSAPVINAHVIDSQVAQSWQSNDQRTPRMQEMEEMTIVEPTAHKPAEVSTETCINDNEMAEVTIKSAEPQQHPLQGAESENADKTSVVGNESVGDNVHSVVDESHIDSTTIQPATADESIEETVPNELLPQNISTTDEEGEKTEEQLIEQPTVALHDTTEIEHQVQESTQDIQNTEDLEISTVANEENTNTNKVSIPEIAPENKVEKSNLTRGSSDPIQSLTSEWSEDEYDTEEQERTEVDNVENNDEEAASIVEPQEIEESIENIQQEMDKHISESLVTDIEQSVSVLPVVAPQEKISSLLNDWEENDSMNGTEENSAENNHPVPSEDPESVIQESKLENSVDKQEPKKDDKIQSLVSDWDDDDEEGKNGE